MLDAQLTFGGAFFIWNQAGKRTYSYLSQAYPSLSRSIFESYAL